MCINCARSWRHHNTFLGVRYGAGQVCEDPSSFIRWVMVGRLYLGWCPAFCYWKRPQVSRMVGVSVVFGPFDVTWGTQR